MDSGQPVPMRPENDTGQMLLDVPKGEHSIELHYDVATDYPALAFARWISLLAWLVAAVYSVKKILWG